MLYRGDALAHVTGPLGKAVEIKRYGTVVCGGGCFGVSAILPVARALKEAGNRVICIQEASTGHLLYWQEKVAAVCDELLLATKDGSAGTKGGVSQVIEALINRGETIDAAFIVGCTFMMMLVSETTRPLKIPTLVALNPVMLDGTGMCGACRVSLGNSTVFACVDGPFLNGHELDWNNLRQRLTTYGTAETAALVYEDQGRVHRCRS
jgi:NAD(P)H-flavin reductase